MPVHPMTMLDGGMSRELERLGAPFRQPEWSALALIETPDLVQKAHELFIQSGARVVTTNSYAVVPFHIGEERFQREGETLAERAGKMARQAVEASKTPTLVAGSLPPLFGSYRPDLYEAGRVEDIAAPLINGMDPYVDVWLLETQSLIAESVAILAAIAKYSPTKRPIWVSFTLEDAEPTAESVIRSGETVASAVEVMIRHNVDAILFNCCQPETIEDALTAAQATLVKHHATNIQLGAYANAFAPQPKDATANDGIDEVRADLTPPAYVTWAQKWRAQGASLIGGCCGIGTEHIAELTKQLK
ncbi:homocysteine S-methyltransferase family protein [Vibrio sp. PP-XX7]